MTLLFEQYTDIIPDFFSFQESLQRPLPTHIRINRLRIKPTTRFIQTFGRLATRAKLHIDTAQLHALLEGKKFLLI